MLEGMGGVGYVDMETALDVGRDGVAVCSLLRFKCASLFLIETREKIRQTCMYTQKDKRDNHLL
jgi:hypothetical protein